MIGVGEDLTRGRYLGLPSLVGKSKKSVFRFVKDKVWKKIPSWNAKMLSRAGRAVLIRSVAQTIPTYTMSCFMLPKTFCQDVEQMLNKFWWSSGSGNAMGIHWLSWDKLRVSKMKGGLGFRSLHGFNIAMLGKQVWNLLSKPNSLVARVMKGKYYPSTSILSATRSEGTSFVWSIIWSAKEELKDGFSWVLGNGQDINILSDPWLRDKQFFV